MKALQLLTIALACSIAATVQLQSQTPAAPRTPVQTLQLFKTQNEQLLEKQAATLQKLEALQKDSEQIKFLAKRT